MHKTDLLKVRGAPDPEFSDPAFNFIDYHNRTLSSVSLNFISCAYHVSSVERQESSGV